MKISLKWNFILALILLEVLLLLALAGLSRAIMSPYFDQMVQSQLKQMEMCLSRGYQNNVDFQVDLISSIMQECQTEYGQTYFLLFDKNQKLAKHAGVPGVQPGVEMVFSQTDAFVAKLPWTTPVFVQTTALAGLGYSYLVYGGTSTFRKAALEQMVKTLAIYGLVIIGVTLIFLLFSLRWVKQNLKKLEVVANQILQGRYEVSLEPVDSEKMGFSGFSVKLVTGVLNTEIQTLRKSAQHDRQTAERMLKVIDAVPDFMLLCRIKDASIEYANAGALAMTGYAYNELAGIRIDKAGIGITKEQWQDWQKQLTDKGVLTNYETVLKNKNGNQVNVLVSASLLQTDNAHYLLLICRDITDRKLVEAAASYAYRQLNYVLDAASEIAIISMDTSGVVQMFNRGAEKMLGYRSREMVGKPMYMEIHDQKELIQRSQELDRQFNRKMHLAEVVTYIPATQGSETRNWIYICKNGQRLNVSLTVTRVQDSAGKIVGFLGIARDISLQLQAERALHDLNHQLEKRVEDRTAELEETNKNLASTMQNLQLAQAELVRSEKLNALGDIVTVVAHEINTPIGNCLTVASTLRERSHDMFLAIEQGTLRRSSLSSYMRDSRDGMEILIRGLQRSSELVSNFKQVAVDQTSEQRRVFKLRKVVDEVVALLMPKLRMTSHQLEITIPEDITMDSFPGPIEQIVTNLINNAILHAFDGEKKGQMKLVASRHGEAEAGQVKIQFSDDGSGIPEHYLNRIFDPFFTTKMGRGGTGLGLNIVHNIIKKMLGGQIEVFSETGKGTTFVIMLPLIAPGTAPVEKRQGILSA